MRRALLAMAVILASAGCKDGFKSSSQPTAAATPAAAPATGASRTVKSRDGEFDGEITGVPASKSKFAKLEIGMRQKEVEALIGEPDDTDSHITGKAFIPFFFGGDTNRTEAFYKNEGWLTYSPAHFAGQANVLIAITVDPNERGFAH